MAPIRNKKINEKENSVPNVRNKLIIIYLLNNYTNETLFFLKNE